MNLTDLQKELRALESKLSVLQMEIEGMKPKEEDSKKQDFERITKLAAKHLLEHVAIAEASEYLIKKYIRLLSFILSSAEKGINEKLLYLMRIVSSAKMKWTAEEVVQFGIEFDVDEIEKSCRELEDYRYVLLADALIMVNFADEGSEKEISLVADIAKFLNVDRDDLEVVSKVVYSYLTDDYEPLVGYIGNGKKLWGGVFRQYIPLTWLEKQRVEIFNSNSDFKNCMFMSDIGVVNFVPSGKVVVASQSLLKIKYKSLVNVVAVRGILSLFSASSNKIEDKEDFKEKELIAPNNGVLYYQFSTDDLTKNDLLVRNREAYILSIFDHFDEVDKWIVKKKA